MLFLTYQLYLPGIQGGFLFDDIPNLSPLGYHGSIDTLNKAIQFISSGFSGPTGRPISLTSFLLDDNTWPSDNATAFKTTNILLHLICGLLIYWITIVLVSQHHKEHAFSSKTIWVALFTASVWLLHPFLVSTVLYIIQRMTILMALFSFLSLIFYIKGRQLINKNTSLAFFFIFIAYLICIPLSVFSKESGALTPLYILLIENVFFKHNTIHNKNIKKIMLLGVYTAAIVTVAMLGYYFQQILFSDTAYLNRNFNLSERVLTEARILFDYLSHWVIPPAQTAGLYNDSISLSKNILTPANTLFSILAHIIIIFLTVKKRHQYPMASFAILFFYIGHIMESTFIPLELYFEHRNYLPFAFLFLPVAHYTLYAKPSQFFGPTLLTGITITLAIILSLRVDIWKDTDKAKFIWAEEAPSSLRAQLDNARYYLFKGNLARSLYFSNLAYTNHPDNPKPLIFNEFIYCLNRGIPVSQKRIDKILDTIGKSSFHISLYEYLDYLLSLKETKQCSNITFTQIDTIIKRTQLQYPHLSSGLQNELNHLRGMSALYKKEPDRALTIFTEILNTGSNINMAMSHIAELANKGYYKDALMLLSHVESILYNKQGILTSTMDYKEEVIRLKKVLKEDIKNAGR